MFYKNSEHILYINFKENIKNILPNNWDDLKVMQIERGCHIGSSLCPSHLLF